jgi:hypothetical protein
MHPWQVSPTARRSWSSSPVVNRRAGGSSRPLTSRSRHHRQADGAGGTKTGRAVARTPRVVTTTYACGQDTVDVAAHPRRPARRPAALSAAPITPAPAPVQPPNASSASCAANASTTSSSPGSRHLDSAATSPDTPGAVQPAIGVAAHDDQPDVARAELTLLRTPSARQSDRRSGRVTGIGPTRAGRRRGCSASAATSPPTETRRTRISRPAQHIDDERAVLRRLLAAGPCDPGADGEPRST